MVAIYNAFVRGQHGSCYTFIGAGRRGKIPNETCCNGIPIGPLPHMSESRAPITRLLELVSSLSSAAMYTATEDNYKVCPNILVVEGPTQADDD